MNSNDDRLELRELVQRLRELPDMREERVRSLREAIEAGTFQVDAEAVADRLIDHMLRWG
jgi:negative regulator of flagellin synthesis FlgM